MLSLLSLGVFAALAAPAAARQDPPVTELGTVEFPAGPARGSARFYLAGTEPRVDVTIHNDTPGPIWWRGAGIGCVSSHWIVEPASVSGEPAPLGFQGIGCSMEKNRPATQAQLDSWSIQPGASDSWSARPFADWDAGDVLVVPALDRWAWCHEITVPRDTPPPRTMEFTCHGILLAWSRATGPRAFIADPADVHLPHCNPFADEPFQRGKGPIPFRVGPLRGTAVLREDNLWPIVDWTLTNPTERELCWSLRGAGSVIEWGFRALEFSEVAFEEDLSLVEVRTRRLAGDFTPSDECRFAPGQTRSGTLSPFLDDPSGRDAWHRPTGPQGLAKWHYGISSTWPCESEPGAEPHFLPTRLHLYWDAERGFDAGLEEPERYLEGRDWHPFRDFNGWESSASIRLGACTAYATANSQANVAHLHVFNDRGNTVYWNSNVPDIALWVRKPGAAINPLALQRGPLELPATGRALDEDDLRRLRLTNGAHDRSWISLDSLQPGRAEPPGDPAPWDVILPACLPRALPPAHDRDFEVAWLRLRWDPAGGLHAAASEAWPF